MTHSLFPKLLHYAETVRDPATWSSALNALVGLGLVVAGAFLASPFLEEADAVAIGLVVGAIGSYNLIRLSSERLEHPDSLRAAGLLSLWLIAFSLSRDITHESPLTVPALAFGIFMLLVNVMEFIHRYKNHPKERIKARHLNDELDSRAFERARQEVSTVQKYRTKKYAVPLLLTIPVGIGSGIGAAVFRYLMYAVHSVFFGILLPELPSHRWIVLLPVLGAGLAGYLIYEFAPEAAGHGVPENMEAIAVAGGRIRHRLPPFKVLVSALTLGAGGSGGREGPIARIGAGVGSSLGQLLGLSPRNTRLLLAAGIAGGIGATFGAPIGGILFSIEIVMMYRVNLYNALVLALTTGIAVATTKALAPHFSWLTFLPFPLPETSVTLHDIAFVLPYGLLMGVVACLWVVVLERTETTFNGLSVPDRIKPALGALPVGVLGIFYAQYGVMGVGYSGLRLAVNDVKMGAVLMLVLALAKLVATQFTIGSGGSGGVFAPTLYIGGLFAVGFHRLVGILPVSGSLLGVVGMGAIFSGAAFSPLTAMFLIAEVFNNYGLVLLLALPCLLSYAVARSVLGASIYTSRLQRKGILANYPALAAQIGPMGDGDTGQDEPVGTPATASTRSTD